MWRLLTLINVLSYRKSLQNFSFLFLWNGVLFSVNNIFFPISNYGKVHGQKKPGWTREKNSIRKPQIKKFWLHGFSGDFGMRRWWRGGTHQNLYVHIFLENDLDRSDWLCLCSMPTNTFIQKYAVKGFRVHKHANLLNFPSI